MFNGLFLNKTNEGAYRFRKLQEKKINAGTDGFWRIRFKMMRRKKKRKEKRRK
jgi:hypothetical protein